MPSRSVGRSLGRDCCVPCGRGPAAESSTQRAKKEYWKRRDEEEAARAAEAGGTAQAAQPPARAAPRPSPRPTPRPRVQLAPDLPPSRAPKLPDDPGAPLAADRCCCALRLSRPCPRGDLPAHGARPDGQRRAAERRGLSLAVWSRAVRRERHESERQAAATRRAPWACACPEGLCPPQRRMA
jgi:hypothetical protein